MWQPPRSLSIVIPALNEEAQLAATIASARGPSVVEVIVVDGGSTDGTMACARGQADAVTAAGPGRALQMNAGAQMARGDVLLFLHADTRLPAGFDAVILRAMADPHTVGGRFDVSLEPSSPLLWLTGELMNLRSRWSGIATGDQAIFVRREVFAKLAGFPPIPLMEDIALSRSLKRMGTIACLRERVVTSSRRWRFNGVLRTVLLMWSLRFLYFVGVAPERLQRWYSDSR
jgi:rSAM/selenodomain-associated transferase 2